MHREPLHTLFSPLLQVALFRALFRFIHRQKSVKIHRMMSPCTCWPGVSVSSSHVTAVLFFMVQKLNLNTKRCSDWWLCKQIWIKRFFFSFFFFLPWPSNFRLYGLNLSPRYWRTFFFSPAHFSLLQFHTLRALLHPKCLKNVISCAPFCQINESAVESDWGLLLSDVIH